MAGKIFDFNLTLPIMTGQVLLLMVFLDKFWVTPVGKVLDERDGYIREQLQKFKARACRMLAACMHAGAACPHACMAWQCRGVANGIPACMALHHAVLGNCFSGALAGDGGRWGIC